MQLSAVIAALEPMPQALQQRLAGLTDAQLRFKPAPEVFSVLESLWHLRDIEVEGYSVRLRRLLGEEQPRLPDMDGSRLAVERRYNQQPLLPALDGFITARRVNLELLRGVDVAQLGRHGHLDTVGHITLRRLLELWVEHDRGHIKELDELLPVLRDPAAGNRPKSSLSLSTP